MKHDTMSNTMHLFYCFYDLILEKGMRRAELAHTGTTAIHTVNANHLYMMADSVERVADL